eukprot:CAMPEP_0206600096 /NCGR_PEP_ID=MMETSP0325_2-20121206/45569_1 /ASSEMBLY_ACC=CAM_ASM_000347 /TAXON_ID=2866 /ORGANISM="Crypthecodinium cohnii, Strain Seligo" /LENGTH=86 /DNA_ID=CAMNT_0054111289 /DNA_START=85 /DNA_END=342 /DNA_ORIENTATION=-
MSDCDGQLACRGGRGGGWGPEKKRKQKDTKANNVMETFAQTDKHIHAHISRPALQQKYFPPPSGEGEARERSKKITETSTRAKTQT